MADFEAPVPLEEETPEDGIAAPLMALLRQQQAQRAQANAGLQERFGQERSQAQGLRSLGLLASFGQNPLLRNLQGEAGQQGGQLEGMAARTEARMDAGRGLDPLGIARLQQTAEKLAQDKELALKRLGQQHVKRELSADPDSPESQVAQATLRNLFPDVDGGMFDTVAETQFESVRKSMEEAAGRRNREAIAKLRRARTGGTGAKADNAIAGATERLGRAVNATGAPGFYSRFDEAQELLSNIKGDVPGFGRIEGLLPDEAISDTGRKLRFVVGQLLSEYRKGQTGAGMSDAERAEYGRITGLMNAGNDAGLKEGLDLLGRAMDARVAATGAGFRPEAVAEFSKRAPRLGQALRAQQPTVPVAPSAPTANLGDMVRVKVNGQALPPMPRSNLEAAKKRAAEKGYTLEVIDG